MRVTALRRTERFEREFKRLDDQLQDAVRKALKELLNSPIPKALRHHTLGGHRPTIHVIDATRNHSHQVTFEVNGTEAILLRIATHKEIDRLPR